MQKIKIKKMNHRQISFFMLLVTVFLSYGLAAQESVVAAGDDVANESGAVSYSVGQAFYNTASAISGSVAEGTQQPYEISVLSVEEEAVKMNISVYPNPTADYIYLASDSDAFPASDVSFRLFDSNGRTIQNGKVVSRQTDINMANLTPATYFVAVSQGNKDIKVFKIIKK